MKKIIGKRCFPGNSRGFTLIELMVVIVILGILAAVLAPRIPAFIVKAKEGRTKGNLANLRSAIRIYYSDNDGIFPSGTDRTALANAIVPRYISRLPLMEMPPYHLASAFERLGSDGGINDAGGWWYQNISTAQDWGEVNVNCNVHKDSGGVYWSTY